jgi:hypothetical protein
MKKVFTFHTALAEVFNLARDLPLDDRSLFEWMLTDAPSIMDGGVIRPQLIEEIKMI